MPTGHWAGLILQHMGQIRLQTFILAPIDRCFDLSRSVDLHVQSAGQTREKAIAGVTHGLMNAGDIVTWEARHFGLRQRLSTKITAFDRPHSFRDSQTQGIFRRFDHDHYFESKDQGTLMSDLFDFECPLGPIGWAADYFVGLHLQNFLKLRNEKIRLVAEGEEWRSFL